MPQEYTVTKVSQQEPKVYEGQYGTTYYIKVMLEGVDEPVEIGKKSPDAIKQGDTVYGTVTDGQYGKKFKAEKKPFGQSGGGKYTRDDSAIRAQWAIGQAMTKFEAGCYKASDENRLTMLHNIRDFARELYVMVDEVKGYTEKPSLKEQWNNTLASKEKATTPPVEAYKDVVVEPSEEELNGEINLADIPF